MQVDLSVIISSYEGRDRIMNENLIVEDNTIYELSLIHILHFNMY